MQGFCKKFLFPMLTLLQRTLLDLLLFVALRLTA